MSNVVSDARFLTPERLLELQETADVQVSLKSLLDGMDLDDPEADEAIVGTLTPAEATLFRKLYHATEKAEAIARSAVGRQLSAIGNSLQAADPGRPIAEILSSSTPSLNQEESKSFHSIERYASMLHSCLWWHVGERLGLHEWRLGVRTRGRIVKIAER